jgi:hypothetical protein
MRRGFLYLFSHYEESAYDPSGFALWRSKPIRRDRPLTREELFRVVPSVFSEDKHESRSERYTYIPTISCWTACSGRLSAVLCLSDPRDPVVGTYKAHAAPASGGADYR